MKIPVHDIPLEGLQVQCAAIAWFPAGEIARQSEPQAELLLRLRNGLVVFQGRLAVDIVLQCDRCLEAFCYPLRRRFQGEIVVGADGRNGEEQSEVLADDDPALTEAMEIDVARLLEQQFFLALPYKNLCASDCRGLCGNCGRNLNTEECVCTGNVNSPFSSLAGLLAQKGKKT